MVRIIGSDTLAPVVSIVIPAKNEAHRIGPTLRSLVNEFDGESVEIVVVNDHSTDETSRIVLSFGGPYAGSEPAATSMEASAPTYWPDVRLVDGPPNHFGKGAALRAGIAASRGEVLVLLDADLPVDEATLRDLIERMRAGNGSVDLLLGSRRLANVGASAPQPWGRRLGGSAFLLVTRMLGFTGVSDPQCGLKVLASTVKPVAKTCVSDGFEFDLEFLMRARSAGLVLVDVPIHWIHRPGSTVRPIRDATATLIRLARLRRSIPKA